MRHEHDTDHFDVEKILEVIPAHRPLIQPKLLSSPSSPHARGSLRVPCKEHCLLCRYDVGDSQADTIAPKWRYKLVTCGMTTCLLEKGIKERCLLSADETHLMSHGQENITVKEVSPKIMKPLGVAMNVIRVDSPYAPWRWQLSFVCGALSQSLCPRCRSSIAKCALNGFKGSARVCLRADAGKTATGHQ
mmetsp:Transcript_9663/g.35413  ORF Transcript_9663/g.35413 Transcript_9663/m.35413 type:complete len:190 (+) Transcript_9663:717-1286(+)